LPAHLPVVSFVGHFVHTKDFYPKKTVIARYFSGQMTQAEASEFISANRINYIFLGKDEKTHGAQSLSYPGLKAIYQNPTVTIYQTSQTTL